MSRRAVGSIRWLRDGVARVEVASGYHPVTGKRRRLSEVVHGSERDAEAALARLLLAIGKVPEADVTVRQYLEGMYLPHVRKRVRARTADGYRSKLETHVIPVLGSTRLAALTPYQLDAWLDGVAGSPRTRLHAYRVLSAALNAAVRWRLLDHSPLRAVEPPKVGRKRPETLSADEARQYLDAFAGHSLEPLIILALAAGLRRSELAALTWADIDLGAATVRVERGHHDHGGEVLVEPPKSWTSARTVSLPSWAVDALRPLRGLGPIVVEDGQAMPPKHVTAIYRREVDRRGLRHVQLKNLRHTHACLLLDAGVDLYTVSRRLGHSTVAVTEAYYVTPGEDADRRAADALGGLRLDAASGTVRNV